MQQLEPYPDASEVIKKARLDLLHQNETLIYLGEQATFACVIISLAITECISWQNSVSLSFFCFLYIKILKKIFLHYSAKTQNTFTKIRIFCWRLVFYDLLWGLILLIILASKQESSFLALCFIFLASTTNGAVMYSSYMSIYAVYYIPCVLVGWASACFFFSDPSTHIIQWGSIPYLVAYIYYSQKSTRTSIEQIRLRLENNTLIKNLEKENQHSRILEQAKTEFYLAASHDLRQPLNALGLYMDSVQTDNLSSEQQFAWRQVRESSNSCRELLRNLFEFTLHESGRLKATPQEVHLDSMMNRIIFDYGILADVKGIVLRYRECSLNINVDPLILDQIIRNLLTNAIKFTTKGGILIGIRRSSTKQRISIEIWDTGPGFSEQAMSSLPEYPAVHHASHNLFDRGAGLGLLIVHRLLPYLEGATLTWCSKPDRGTVFRILLPMHRPILEADKKKPDHTA